MQENIQCTVFLLHRTGGMNNQNGIQRIGELAAEAGGRVYHQKAAVPDADEEGCGVEGGLSGGCRFLYRGVLPQVEGGGRSASGRI